MEQMNLKLDRKSKEVGYVKSRNNNAEYSPTFTNEWFVKTFDKFCKENNLNKTATAQKWLIERLQKEMDDKLNNMSREELIEFVRLHMAARGAL